MTGDSDDVSASADKKPKGSLAHPPSNPDELRADENVTADDDDEHLTGEAQAQRNREVDPPA